MVEVVCALIAAVATIISANTARRVERNNKKAEIREERRAHESRLAMDLMYATCALSLTNAKKLGGMHTNGDVEEAMEAARNAKLAYEDLVRDNASQRFAK